MLRCTERRPALATDGALVIQQSEHLAAAPPPPSFPVAWPSYGDSLLHWSRDAARGPFQMTRLDAALVTAWTDAGQGHAQRVYGLPARVRQMVFNSWLYVAAEPASQDEAELARLREGVDRVFDVALESHAANWSSRWLPGLERIAAELDAVGAGRDAAADLARVERLGASYWEIRIEMALPAERARRSLERRRASDRQLLDHLPSPVDRAIPLVSAPSEVVLVAVGESDRYHRWSPADRRAVETVVLGDHQLKRVERLLTEAARCAAAAAGAELHAVDAIDDAVDVFHLALDEVRHGLASGGDLRLRAAAGRHEASRFRGAPPALLGRPGRLHDPYGWAIGDVRFAPAASAAVPDAPFAGYG
jgi:hypothetical protein